MRLLPRSNCVVNLSPDKPRVFGERFRVLKPGGRLAISDVVARTALPEAIRRDLALYAGCIAGASPVAQLEAMLTASGFIRIRVTPQDESRSFIRDWVPGRDIADYVVSALIEAVKPEPGLLIAIVAGLIIGELKMEPYLEDWVRAIHQGAAAAPSGTSYTWVERFQAGWRHVREIVGKVWPYVLAGIGLGAAIHGFVPEDFMASFMGRDVWWAVPAAVVLGVPMYTNAAGILPIVEALIGKGAALGTTLAFMMSVIALSAPEMLILRKVLK